MGLQMFGRWVEKNTTRRWYVVKRAMLLGAVWGSRPLLLVLCVTSVVNYKNKSTPWHQGLSVVLRASSVASSADERTPSLAKTRERWTSTVRTDTHSSSAMTLLSLP